MSTPGEREVRFEGTVLRIEPVSPGRSKVRFRVTMRVDRALSESFELSEFAFGVHSPSRAGIAVGSTHTVRATRMPDGGYVVDEAQWGSQLPR